jgi:tRNA-binding protein
VSRKRVGPARKPEVSFDTFEALDIRAGTVVRAEPFPEARRPSIKVWVDFGEPVGVLQSSAQLTRRYTPEGLAGTRVIGVVNFAPLRVAGFRSECLVLGVLDPGDSADVVLVRPDDHDVEGWSLG